MPEGAGSKFTVQWQTTSQCKKPRCRFCYVFYGRDKTAKKRELDLKENFKILDDLFKTVTESFGVPLKINFSGGDPLRQKDFFELMQATKDKGIPIGILGNPCLIDNTMAKKLHEIGIKSYQLSLDGKKKTHDWFRGEGSYEKTVSAIRILTEHGIRVHVMATIGIHNTNELDGIINSCIEAGANLFAFDLMIPNNCREVSQILKPEKVRELLLHYYDVSASLSKKHSLVFGRKNNLFTLLEEDLGIESGLICQSRNSKETYAGCSIGMNALAILPDGTVYPCRRLPLVIGKFPEQTMEEVFFGEKLKLLRQEKEIEKCGICNLRNVCRGCRAMAFAVGGSYFSQDPSCWKNFSRKKRKGG